MMSAAPDDSWALHPTTNLNSSFTEIPTTTLPTQVFSPVSSSFLGSGPDLSGGFVATTTIAPVDDSFNAISTVIEPSGGSSSVINNENSNKSNNNMTTPNQLQTFPLIFSTSSEVPVFQVPYHWWEADARTVLWSFDVRQISLVIRFGLFHDSNKPRTALQRRDASFLDTFLASILQPYELPFVPTLSQTQKVEEILRRCQATMPMNISWSWSPSQALLTPKPAIIAQEIEAESQLQFKAVPFEAWARCALGFPAAEVDWFFLQHNVLYVVLLNYLQAHSHEIFIYRQVEKLLRGKSPFAHKAVVRCLKHFQSEKDPQIPDSNTPSLAFIAGPIQDLFRKFPASLISTLKTLSVIAIRFQQNYIHTPNVDWYKKLDTSARFLDDLLVSLSPTELARSLTRADQSMFAQLSREQLMDEKSPTTEALHTRWCNLVVAVKECCIALPEIVPFVQECIEILHSLRNYNSTLALIQGLHHISSSFLWVNTIPNNTQTPGQPQPQSQGPTVNLYSLVPTNVFYLSDTSNNYAAYRQAMKVTPGIPFLLPHIIEYRQRGQSALDELFTTT